MKQDNPRLEIVTLAHRCNLTQWLNVAIDNCAARIPTTEKRKWNQNMVNGTYYILLGAS